MKEICKEMVMSGYSLLHCQRRVFKDGYCNIHHPDTVLARRKKSEAAYEIKRKKSLPVRYNRIVKQRDELLLMLKECVERMTDIQYDCNTLLGTHRVNLAKDLIKRIKAEETE